jgi:V/A-type H+-transporting ATPase subunit E
MATQQVTEKILEDAKREAQEILEHYKREAAHVQKQYETRITQEKAHIDAEAETVKKTEFMRLVSQRNLELRKEIVAEKRKHIIKIIEEAIEKLPEHKQYFSFLTALITNSGEKTGELCISTGDLKRYEKQLEKFLKENSYDFKIVHDDSMRGGVLIRKERIVYHGSLDLISELLRDELTIAVSNKLF